MTTPSRLAARVDAPERRFSVKAAAGGLGGALLASLCCIPGAVAIFVGASAGTVASLFRLLEFQWLFQAGGLAVTLGVSWFLLRRSRKSCAPAEYERRKGRAPLYALLSFSGMFVVLNVVIIPWLERSR